MSAMPLYLAVDAGGTTTNCLLADDSSILARHSGASLKLIRVTETQAHDSLNSLLSAISERSGASLRDVACTCIGLAGISIPSYVQWIREAFAQHVGGKLLIVGDEEIALDAAFPGARGLLVLAGTGSNVIARSADGMLVRAGGWGPALGDQGSGVWIGSQALHAAFRAYDAGEPTSLIERIAAHANLSCIEDFVAEFNRVPGPDLAALTPIILACAQDGDAVAMRVLASAGQELAVSALIALRKLRKLKPNAPPPALAFSGSILRHVSLVRDAMIDCLHRQIPELEIRLHPVEPINGALWRARNFFG